MECKHGYLEWVADGDKRLICRKCDTYFVLIDGEPTKIIKNEETNHGRREKDDAKRMSQM